MKKTGKFLTILYLQGEISINVNETKKLNLCLSCEICKAVCPSSIIEMVYNNGQFLPIISDNCNDCGFCLKICPGYNLDPHNIINNSVDKINGKNIGCYICFSNEKKQRENSASGGLITTLLIEFIKNKDFDKVFCLNFDVFKDKPARLVGTNDLNEIKMSSRSKYIPVSVYNVINKIKKYPEGRYVIVATPCLIQGIKSYMNLKKLDQKNILFLGLFCDRTLNFNIYNYYEKEFGSINEKLLKLVFRTKEKYGWPGHSKVWFDSGREQFVDRKIRTQLKDYFQLNRCLLCLNGKFNPLADISFGDCYIPGEEDFLGKSNIIIRTPKGEKYFNKYNNLFTSKSVKMSLIVDSQGIELKNKNLEYSKIFVKENMPEIELYSNVESKKRIKEFSEYAKKIKLGKKNQLKRIKLSIQIKNLKNKIFNIFRLIIIGIFILLIFLKDIIHFKTSRYEKDNAKPILIVGGGTLNKGAQAMTFRTITNLKEIYPENEIYILSDREFKRSKKTEELYALNFLPWNILIKLNLLGLPKWILRSNINEKNRKILKNANFVIDISGYALSSQWGLIPSIDYILNIMLAKKFNISYYIFPQSIGPFKYKFLDKIIIMPLIKTYLKYPEIIFTREKEGFNLLSRFKNVEVKKSYDIVLQKGEYDVQNIFKVKKFKKINIPQKSVGIVPNSKVSARITDKNLAKMYRAIIETILSSGRKVFIFRHSHEDYKECEKIKKLFPENDDVIFIKDDLNVLELESLINNFEFIVASRYHSVIHALKNNVPPVVIGWATKYSELLEEFYMSEYYFDIRKPIKVYEISQIIEKLILDLPKAKVKISLKNDELNKTNLFEVLKN